MRLEDTPCGEHVQERPARSGDDPMARSRDLRTGNSGRRLGYTDACAATAAVEHRQAERQPALYQRLVECRRALDIEAVERRYDHRLFEARHGRLGRELRQAIRAGDAHLREGTLLHGESTREVGVMGQCEIDGLKQRQALLTCRTDAWLGLGGSSVWQAERQECRKQLVRGPVTHNRPHRESRSAAHTNRRT